MTSGATSLLEVEGLRVDFETDDGLVTAVDGLSLRAERGRSLCLVGESGSGKSVAAMSILGLAGANARVSGQAWFEGRPLGALDPERVRRLRGTEIAMVFQDPLSALHPLYTVGSQIAEAIRAHRTVSRAAASRRATELLDVVGMPDPERRSSDYSHQLSGGMRQRALLAVAIANEPKLLIADEPTTALDVTTQARILALIAKLRDELGMAVILITHDLGVVAEIADDVAVMRAGRIVEQGPAATVLGTPRDPHTRRLLESTVRIDRPPRPRAEGVRARRDIPPRGRGSPLLEIDRLVKHFPVHAGILLEREVGVVRAVDGVSATIDAAEMLAVVGESGCGKSTLCRTILGLTHPTSGSVRLLGRELAGPATTPARALRREVQMVFQDPYASLNPRRTVAQTVADPIVIHGLASGAELRRRVAGLLERVGLESGYLKRFPHELSGGERQRVAIARALGPEPKLIVADEPVTALDAPIRAQVLALLDDLQRDLGVAYLLVAHDLGLVRHVADRIAVMYLGQIVEIGPAEAVCTTPIHPYTRALLAATPIPDPAARRDRSGLAGDEVPSPMAPPDACRFHTRCRLATSICRELAPELVDHGGGHLAACHHPLGDARQGRS